MLRINYKKNWYEIEFEGIKIFETKFSTNFIKSIIASELDEPNLVINNKNIKPKNVIYINEFSKYSDFLSLNKSNYLYKKIIELIKDNSLVNEKLIKTIIESLNEELDNEVISYQYDINKIISGCFELNELGYINDEEILRLLNKMEFDEKKLIIFDNVSYINYNKAKQLLNNFDVLIICNDIRGIIDNITQLELCCFANEYLFDIVNIEKLLSYLEIKTSLQINQQDMNNYLQFKNNQKSSIINFYLKSL